MHAKKAEYQMSHQSCLFPGNGITLITMKSREERLKLYEMKKQQARELWETGIPDIDLNLSERETLRELLSGWDAGFQLQLLARDFPPLSIYTRH